MTGKRRSEFAAFREVSLDQRPPAHRLTVTAR